MSQVNYIPEGYTSITPYLIFKDAAEAMEFYKKAFGAVETVRMNGPNNSIAHAEMRFGNSMVMMADEAPQMKNFSAQHYGGSPIGLMFYVPNVDEVVAQAIATGAKAERPVEDQFYGDRTGGVIDPFGYRWHVGTHIRDVSAEEMKAAMAAMAG